MKRQLKCTYFKKTGYPQLISERSCILLTFIIYLLPIFLSGCGACKKVTGHIKESISYDEKIIIFERSPEIEISGDAGNIEVFNHEEKSVKFEILKKIKRVYTSQEELESDFKKFNITTEYKADKILLKFKYDTNKLNPENQSIDIRMYIPKNIKSIDFKLSSGKIKIYDDLNCNIFADLNMASMDIKKMNGILNFKGEMSNIKISCGTIKNGSIVKVGTGNIDIKSEYEEGGYYEFETNTGNIDLSISSNFNISFESTGFVQMNEFKMGEFPTKIKVKSDIGRICINKY